MFYSNWIPKDSRFWKQSGLWDPVVCPAMYHYYALLHSALLFLIKSNSMSPAIIKDFGFAK